MIIRVLTVLALLLIAAPAYAEGEAIGSLMAVQGNVTVKRAGAEKAETAAVAMPIHLHDTIETGPDSRAVALFVDETELTLGADALTTIDEYVFDPATELGNKANLNVARGAFLYVSGLIGKSKRPDVEIKMAYGAIGLRGTTVWGGELDQYGVFVLDGKVSVQTKRGTVILGKGEGVDIAAATAAPSNRKVWDQPKIDRAVATIALKDQDAATKRIAAEKERLKTEREKLVPPKEDKNAPKPPVNPEITPEQAPTPVPEKRTNRGFGDDDEAQQVEDAQKAVKERREERTPTAPPALAP